MNDLCIVSKFCATIYATLCLIVGIYNINWLLGLCLVGMIIERMDNLGERSGVKMEVEAVWLGVENRREIYSLFNVIRT